MNILVNGEVRAPRLMEIAQMRELLKHHGFAVPADPELVAMWWLTFEPRLDPAVVDPDEQLPALDGWRVAIVSIMQPEPNIYARCILHPGENR